MDDCRFLSYTDLIAKAGMHCNAQTALNDALSFCHATCPSPRMTDFHLKCKSHAYHGFKADFMHTLHRRSSLLWPIFFLIWTVALGSYLSRLFPKWLPYTVGLLIVGVTLGAIAQRLELGEDCPMYARLHDRDGDGLISRSEWDQFVCTGCVSDSYCASWQNKWDMTYAGLNETTRSEYVHARDHVRSCLLTGCRYTFDQLDAPWKLSSMLAEFSYGFPGGSHRRLASASSGSSSLSGSSSGSGTGGSLQGDGYLSGDELWTPQCNLLRDMLSLMDIDPHMMLVVFLPALLFESACFGIDMGIFRKQLPQILLMAFPAMALASFITALLLYTMAPASWTIWVCWLIGIIASATDPVAVVALLKELGAAKTLGTLIEGESLLNVRAHYCNDLNVLNSMRCVTPLITTSLEDQFSPCVSPLLAGWLCGCALHVGQERHRLRLRDARS